MNDKHNRIAVVALGGNAISPPDGSVTIHDQFRHTRKSLDVIVAMLHCGYRIAITHGNGPQIGNALMRQELSRDKVPELPLGVLVASTEGWMGYMIEQSLLNRLQSEEIERSVASIITQVLVDPGDPSLKDPSKYIGKTYTEKEAHHLADQYGWIVKRDRDRDAWRRVTGSPAPLEVLNGPAISSLLDKDWIVICTGGGGIPVYRDENGLLEGLDAVIDKDRASAVLGYGIGASDLLILTDVDNVAVNFGKPDQQDLDRITMKQAVEYLDQGHFPPGSMGPKIESAVAFLEHGGQRVIITSLSHVIDALDGKAGTTLTME